MGEEDYITDDMLDALKEQLKDSIDAIAISESAGNGTVESGGDSANITISGVNEDYFMSNDLTLLIY